MLTCADVLACTGNGRDVFRHYLGLEPKAGRNFQNPFTGEQQTPSFNVFPDENGVWRYKDFATGHKGSWLDFVMETHDLTVPEALNHIAQSLGLAVDSPTENCTRRDTPSALATATKLPRPFQAIYRDAFSDEELAYWQPYGVTAETLEKYYVRPLQRYTASRADGSTYTITPRHDNPVFAYDAGNGFVKAYAPLAAQKAHKFNWPTGQPTDYVFGLAQLSTWHPVILLAAGEKDAMVLSAHGFGAVTVGSETAAVSAELVAELKNRCDEVLVCYDADETGRRRSQELAAEHGLRWVEWPAELAPHGKDAADFYRAARRKVLSQELLVEAIRCAHLPPQAAAADVLESEPASTSLPMLPAEVYSNLPDLLQRACAPFEGRNRDVVLTSSLGVLSGCFPSVSGIYGQQRLGLNLFTFIAAPAASGKGNMLWARRLAQPYHKQMVSESQEKHLAYKAELAAYQAAGKGTPPQAPPRQLFYLPGDTTAAALLDALAANGGRGTIFESEADTLSTAVGGEHGKFGDKLCKMFHHEPVPLMRKGENLYLEIERPYVSIVLSGTPAQLPRLMPNAENGLVSRFLFYCFEAPRVWCSGAPGERPALEPLFEELGQEVSRMIAATPEVDGHGQGGVSFTLSPADWQRLDACGAAGLAEACDAAGDAGASSAFRLGLIAFRLIGLLTVLRCFENGEVPAGQLEAAPQDVTTALLIIDTLRHHALHVLATLPQHKSPAAKATGASAKAAKVERAFQLRSTGMSVRDIGIKVGRGKSTVQDWLSKQAA